MTQFEPPAHAFFSFSGALIMRVGQDGVVTGPEGELLTGAKLRHMADIAEQAKVHCLTWNATDAMVLSLVQRVAVAEARVTGAAGTMREKISDEELEALCRAYQASRRTRADLVRTQRESGRAISWPRLDECWQRVRAVRIREITRRDGVIA